VFVTCFNRFEGGVGEEMTRGCVLTFLYDGRLHRERRKTERERKVFVCFTSPAALQHREKKYCVRKKN
jgi:hypothetical protein